MNERRMNKKEWIRENEYERMNEEIMNNRRMNKREGINERINKREWKRENERKEN